MGFLKNLVGNAVNAVNSARSITTQITETAFLEAAVAMGFLIGGADGDFDADERSAMIELVKNDPTLGAFDEDQVATAFNKMNGLYNITVPRGNRKALEVLAKISEPQQRKALMEIGAVLATINGSVDDTELAALGKAATALKENVDDYKDLLEV